MNKKTKEQALRKFRQHVDFWNEHSIEYEDKDLKELKKDCGLDKEGMIEINKSKGADSRTCDYTQVTKATLLENSEQHINDVQKGMLFFVGKLIETGQSHDKTKLSHIDDFYRDFQTGFKSKEWWKMHQKTERHHLRDPQYIQDDVNLVDILEMLTDGVMAGLARTGEYRKEPIPEELLRRAFDNTIKLLLENVKVVDNG